MTSDSPRACSGCGAPLLGESAFCGACGADVTAARQEVEREQVLNEILGADVLRVGVSPPRPKLALSLDRPERAASVVSRTMEIDPFPAGEAASHAARNVTEVEGVPIVGGRSGVTMEVNALASPAPPLTSIPAEVHHDHGHVVRRVLPLAMISGLAIGIVAFVAVRVSQQVEVTAEGSTEIIAMPDAPVEVALPAMTTFVGLTDDNKEAWLALCFRVSEHPQTECRVSALRDSGEYPATTAEVPALMADALEVSNAHFADCVNAGACHPLELDACRFYSQRGFEFSVEVPDSFSLPTHPVVCVSYAEAAAYCAWRGMRLPTQAEWERLARRDEDSLFPWRGGYWAPGILNWGERDMTSYPIPGRLDGAEFTTDVTQYDDGATAEGIYNLLGNAAEWVAPTEHTEEGAALVMGGSYVDDIRTLRVTRTEEVPMTQRRSTIGFRCVRNADEGAVQE